MRHTDEDGQMHGDADGPGGRRRLAAMAALLGVLTLAIMVVVFVVDHGLYVLLGLTGWAIAVGGMWWVVTERTWRRIVGAVAALIGLTAIAIIMSRVFAGAQAPALRMLAAATVLAAGGLCARYALLPDLRALDQSRRRRRPSKPVLICNPKSGGGKVEKFQIVDAARRLGVTTVVLRAGDDLERLARDAIADGADCLGMAGGDGSQALVASIAVEHDLPFVCISAGTRNHFALDLGLDRADPRNTLSAFVDAVERRVDYATVNGRLFVNNVSLGVYATIVQQDSYRDNKTQTATALLPGLLGGTAAPFDLQFTTPHGHEVDGSFIILVSNNPYATTASFDAGERRRMNTGTLGVLAVSASTGTEAARLMALSAVGMRRSSPNWHEFTAADFEIRSRSGQAFAGVDGEALDLTTPLHFRSHHNGLRLLVPAGNQELAARREAREVDVRALFDVARGRRPQI